MLLNGHYLRFHTLKMQFWCLKVSLTILSVKLGSLLPNQMMKMCVATSSTTIIPRIVERMGAVILRFTSSLRIVV
nr:hypothetical protein Iba_chr03eCG3780 [Ipomoea batatas]